MKFKALPVTSLEDATIDFEQLQASGVDRIGGTTVPLTHAAWIAPTLINSWANIGGAFETAGYLKDPLGFVHLKGVVSGGTSGTIAFVLPSGYRPGAMTQNAALLGNLAAGGGVEVATNGNVELLISSAVSVSMSGITFLAEN